MGAVWAATHQVTHKHVALKFLHKKNDDADARRRVLREARAACAVQHPNVCTVHDVVEDEDGTPILVMDLLRGESLADKLTRERTLSPADAVHVISPVLSALVVAHSVGIVHRDLKPDNIFLVDGLATNPRVLDFGVAKLSGKDAATKETNRLTETGAMIGTPHYMAPEQAFGESDVDARADIWAAGAVLYECLSGFTPADGQNLGQILKVLASGSIPPLLSRAPNVPPQLAAIVDGMLRIERDERTASAALVLEQLAAIGPQSTLRSEIAPAPALPGSDGVTPAPERPHTVPSLVGTTHEATIVDPPKRARRVGPWIAGVAATLVLAAAATVTTVRFKGAHHDEAVQAAAVGAASIVAANDAPPQNLTPSNPTPSNPTPNGPSAGASEPASTPASPAPSAASAKKKGSAPAGAGRKASAQASANAGTPAAKGGGTTGGTPLINEPTF